MDFQILGPLEVHGERGAVGLEGRQAARGARVLLLHANEPVSAERLAVGAVGRGRAGGRDQDGAGARLAVAQGARGPRAWSTTTPAGYRLRVRPGELDAERFEQLRRRRAAGAGRAATPERGGGAVARGARAVARPAARRAWSSSRSRRRRSRGWRSSAWPRWRRAWRPISRAGRHAALVSELRQLRGRAPDARAARGAADARAVSLRTSGRGARGLPRGPPGAGRGRSAIEPGPELQRPARGDPAPGPVARAAGAGGAAAELDAATAPPLVGRDAELAVAARRTGSGARGGRGAIVAVARRARDRQDAARGRAGRRGRTAVGAVVLYLRRAGRCPGG